jgi:hypothetical protein
MLTVSHLDVDSLDVTFAMDFDYMGSHDEVISEALLGESSFSCLLDLPSTKPIAFSPSMVVALSEDEFTQARISIESKTTTSLIGAYEDRFKKLSSDEAISLFFTVRQYPPRLLIPLPRLAPEDAGAGEDKSGGVRFDMLKSFEYQCRLAEQLMTEKIVPNFVMPLTETIAQKRLM